MSTIWEDMEYSHKDPCECTDCNNPLCNGCEHKQGGYCDRWETDIASMLGCAISPNNPN